MVWRCLKHYGKSKAFEVLADFAKAVVAFDPDLASRAQLEMLQAELDKLGKRLSEAEAEVQREHLETSALRRVYGEYLAVGRMLEAELVEAGHGDRVALEMSLARIVARLEQLKPEIEREEQEDREVQAWGRELHRSFAALAHKLRESSDSLRAAQRRMEVARLGRERADVQESSGITSAVSALSVALDTMNQQTNRLRAEAEALQLKAGLLQTEQLDGDPHVAAALDRVRGRKTSGKKSLSERLAALSEQPGPARLGAAE